MALAGITPPATLSVVPGFFNDTQTEPWLSLDWNSTAFYNKGSGAAQPSSEVLRIATLAAHSMAIIPPTPPAINSSFGVQFFGPSLQCSLVNSSQQMGFNNYTEAMARSYLMKVTKSLFESGKLRWDKNRIPEGISPLMNVYSAFSPGSSKVGWLGPVSGHNYYSIDAYNNWIPDIPFDNFISNRTNFMSIKRQLWIQTADQGVVCTLGNASFDVSFEFVNAVQTKAEYRISMFKPFPTPINSYLPSTPSINSYMAMYLAFSGLLNGNVSTTLIKTMDIKKNPYIRSFDGNVTIYDSSSKILQHGLSACDEFVHGYVSHQIIS
jgi:hypothetical protein